MLAILDWNMNSLYFIIKEETFKIFCNIYIFRILIIKTSEESVINLRNSIHVNN